MSEVGSELEEDRRAVMDASHLETRLLSQLQDPAQEMDTDGESQVDSPQDSPCAETPLAPSPTPPQLQTPDRSCPGTSFLPHLDLSRVETPLLSSPLNLSQTDTRFVSIQDISEMETPFLPVPPLPESPTEAPLLPPLPLLTGHPAVPVGLDCSDNGIHSCMSSASCLASAMSTPLAIKKFKASDSDTGTDLLPVCRICQLPGDKEDFLFSPCRCSGTMMFVHYLCLLKWIEISTRRTKRPPKCELCHFQYIRHKRFKLTVRFIPHHATLASNSARR